MNAFGRYHPIVSIIYFASVIIISMFVNNPIIQISACIGGILFAAVLINKRVFLKDCIFYFFMLILIGFSNPLFSHNGVTPLFFLNGNPITFESLIFGFILGITVVSIMLWFKCFTIIMSSDKLLFLFGRIIPKISLILSMALRFVPMLKRQINRIKMAQKSLGLYSSDSIYDKFKSALNVYYTVIAWSFENAIDASSVMKARGYGLLKRTNFSTFKFQFKDALFLLISCVLSLICFWGILNGSVHFDYYPNIDHIDYSLTAISVYISYGILVIIPFIIEVKEALLWKYCVSKI